MTIIKFSDYLKDDIDAQYKLDDMFKYCLSYKMSEKIYSIDIWATSITDAEERVKAIRNSLKYEGQLIKEVL